MNTAPTVVGEELDAAYYDAKFNEDPMFGQHYTESNYYALWATILDRLRRQSKPSILEIGCGTGQLANVIRDMQFATSYLGIDFSNVAIQQARKVNPGWEFRCANIFEDRALEEETYNTVISTEFLEHVKNDVTVIERIRPGTMVIASVPNFPHKEHVRHFANTLEVYNRYIGYFKELYVVPIKAHKLGLMHFLMQGPRKSD